MRLYEINKIEDFDTKTSDELLQLRYDAKKDKLFYMKNLASVELWGEHWPLTKSDNNRFYFLSGFGQPIGFATLQPVSNKIFTVKMIYITPKFQKGGIAYAFYSFLLDNNVALLSDVDLTNASIMLWKKLATTYKVTLLQYNKPVKVLSQPGEVDLAFEHGARLLARK
jgi:hypothetical protein